MPSTSLIFSSRDEHRTWLATQAILPAGFRVGTARLEFMPREAPKPARMNLTLLALEKPSPDFAALFTRNAFPGAPVLIGRKRLEEPAIGAILINNKISNVCAPGGVEAAERTASEVARLLAMPATSVLPCSTGVIGWSLPVDAMIAALPTAVASLAGGSAVPLAEGIVTTDLYPKARRATLGHGSILGVAKGAGMVEPNLATMLAYLLTDLAVPRDTLRAMLRRVVEDSFNMISVDSDTSTSDTVVLVSSGRVPCTDLTAFESSLRHVCRDLAEDVVRNGEGVRHVMRVNIKGAPTRQLAVQLGKAIVNAPLFKCAIAGNDPNVGRLIQAIGKSVGAQQSPVNLSRLTAKIGGIEIFSGGVFQLNPQKEASLVAHLRQAELYKSAQDKDGVFTPPVDYPSHERVVDIAVDLALGDATATVYGGDLTHEYVSENADYRS
ncbi:MAG: bifunctional ornithine acetyltransferase/N-acetylglutamate synthase [Opitutaceae bacterium]|nr:bifunctional ornithine acetyltransferase/N-acetylglutamate synthase [Opitutaceae bacterium]